MMSAFQNAQNVRIQILHMRKSPSAYLLFIETFCGLFNLNIFYSEFQFVYRYNNEDNTNI